MECKTFRETELSRLGMGTMRLPTEGDVDGASIDYPRAEAIVDYAMASGVNYYDTAWTYHGGTSEDFLGHALAARYPRDSFHVATKYYIQAERDYRRVFETQLKRLTPAAERPLRAAHPDWSLASWALRWVRALPQVQTVLSGMSNLAQVADNVRTFSDEATLSEEDRGLLASARTAFHDELSVPCTACRYCTDGCPAGIDIPGVLAAYNRYRMGSSGALADVRSLAGGQPEDCVGCGACAAHCPQGIDVHAIMAEVSGRLAQA